MERDDCVTVQALQGACYFHTSCPTFAGLSKKRTPSYYWVPLQLVVNANDSSIKQQNRSCVVVTRIVDFLVSTKREIVPSSLFCVFCAALLVLVLDGFLKHRRVKSTFNH